MNLLTLVSQREHEASRWLKVIRPHRNMLTNQQIDLSVMVRSDNAEVRLGYALWRWLKSVAIADIIRNKVSWLLGTVGGDVDDLPRHSLFHWLGEPDFQRDQRIILAVIAQEIEYARCDTIDSLDDDSFLLVDHMIDAYELGLLVAKLRSEDFRTDVSEIVLSREERTIKLIDVRYPSFDLRGVHSDYVEVLRAAINQNRQLLGVIEPVYRRFVQQWLLQPWIDEELRSSIPRMDWLAENYTRKDHLMDIQHVIESVEMSSNLRPEINAILRRISQSIEEFGGYKSFIDNLKHVGGDYSGLLGNHKPINLIPSDHKSACTEIVLAFANGKSGGNGFKEILKRFATHLSDCDGIAQIALFFTDRFAPDEYAAYDSIMASHQRKGVVLLPLLVTGDEIHPFSFPKQV